MNNFDFFLFDLDGTLTDPALGITNSYVHALRHFGIEIPSYKELCSFIGPPLRANFIERFGFDEAQTDEAVKAYREYFAEKGLFENTVYDGIPELLADLKSRGKTLMVATSKPEQFSVQILEHFDLAKYFTKICGSAMDESRSEKSEVIAYALSECGDPEKGRVVMIGDRKFDIEGAKANRIGSCGVLYGYGSRDELQAAGADFIAENVASLRTLFE